MKFHILRTSLLLSTRCKAMNSLKRQMFINVGFADKHSVISPLSPSPPLPYPVSFAPVQFSPRLNSEEPAQNATETHATQATSNSFLRGFHLRSMFLIIFITSSRLRRTQPRSSVDAEFLATRERKISGGFPTIFRRFRGTPQIILVEYLFETLSNHP